MARSRRPAPFLTSCASVLLAPSAQACSRRGRILRAGAVAFSVLVLAAGLAGCKTLAKTRQGSFSCSCGGTGCSCDHCKGLTSDCPCRASDAYGASPGAEKDDK